MRRAVFVPRTPESAWTDDIFPGKSAAELPVAGKLFSDYAMQVALRFGYHYCDVIDWSHSKTMALHLAQIDQNNFSVAYRKPLGDMPEGLAGFLDFEKAIGKEFCGDMTVVWGLHLTGHGRAESQLTPLTDGEFRKTPTGIYSRENGKWFRLVPFGAAVKSPRSWLQANLAVLHNPDRFTLPGYSSEPDVHLGRNVVLEHGVAVKAPVLLCDNIWCSRNVELDGDVIIAPGSFIGEGAHLAKTVVCDDTYVGAGLDLTNKIIAGRRVIDPETGAWVDISEKGVARNIGGFAWKSILRDVWRVLRGKSAGRRG